jgi:hypothetical protein
VTRTRTDPCRWSLGGLLAVAGSGLLVLWAVPARWILHPVITRTARASCAGGTASSGRPHEQQSQPQPQPVVIVHKRSPSRMNFEKHLVHAILTIYTRGLWAPV